MYRSFKPFKKGLSIIKKNVSSPFSIFLQNVQEQPLHMPIIKRGKGPYLYDYDDNRFVDFDLSSGSLLLGHSSPHITSTMKSWLNRGYAPGYPVVSYEMLSNRLCDTIVNTQNTGGIWIYYNSSFEAILALMYLLRQYLGKGKGIYLSSTGISKRFTPFNSTIINQFTFEDIDKNVPNDTDYIVLRFSNNMRNGNMEGTMKRLTEKETILISDETDFNSHVHFSHSTDLGKYIDIRIFGNFLSSGLPFGCIFVKNRVFHTIKKYMSYEVFQDISSLSFFLPLYKMKAIIRYLGILIEYGGIQALIKKSQAFYKMLNDEYFDIVNGIVYLKRTELLLNDYKKLRLTLLKNGLYFPLSIDIPIYISFSHSDELLENSAKRINLVFDTFYR